MVNAYVPNSGEGLKRLDYRIGKWVRACRVALRLGVWGAEFGA